MGHHNIRFDGDRHSQSGVWGPPNSRANFCEEDYALSLYVAEFINSLTNLAYVYLAFQYMYGPGSRGIFAPKLDFMSISLLGLGIGSFLFHATLRQLFEFADELSMLVLTWSMLQATLTMRQSPAKARGISIVLGLCYVGFAVFYVQSPSILYQVVMFVAGVVLIVLRMLYLFYWMQPALPSEKSRAWNVRSWKALSLCLAGYVLWNIDLEYCAELRAIRHRVGLPWAWLLELHGWWHIMTAIGAAQFMNVAREIRAEVQREQKRE